MLIFSTIADLLLAPVQIAIYSLFVVSLFETGRMLVQWPLRAIGRNALRDSPTNTANTGFPNLLSASFRRELASRGPRSRGDATARIYSNRDARHAHARTDSDVDPHGPGAASADQKRRGADE